MMIFTHDHDLPLRAGGHYWLAGLLVTACVLVAACEPSADDQQSSAPPPPTVTLATPLVKEVVEISEYTGRFEAVDFVELRARVSGYLDAIEFQAGQSVEQDDLLFVIDQRPFALAVDQAEANLQQRRTELRLAVRERERGEQLVANRTIAESTFDERVTAERSASAAVQAAQAALRQAQLDLEFTEVRAPVAGRIGREQVTVGNLISGGSDNATMLTSISSVDPIYFFFDVNEADYLSYARNSGGQSDRDGTKRVFLALADENEFNNQGVVDFVDPRFDFNTSTVTLRAVVDNPNGTFIPGLFAKIQVPASDEYEAILVPDSVIGTDQTVKFVYVVDDDNVVAQRPVTLGPLIDGLRVIRDGVAATERLVINGLQRVRPGAPVTPEAGEIIDEAARNRP
ncbi:MAG: efflux RND transporter periplasmic adaptor subunit [Pseudomonadota bacterium]